MHKNLPNEKILIIMEVREILNQIWKYWHVAFAISNQMSMLLNTFKKEQPARLWLSNTCLSRTNITSKSIITAGY